MKSSHKHSDAPPGRARCPWGLEVMTIVALATPVDQREAAFVRVRAQGPGPEGSQDDWLSWPCQSVKLMNG